MCPFKLRNVCNDQSVKFYSLILIFSTLCVVHDLIFPRKLFRRHLPITFVYSVNHASAQALRPITFTQHYKTTRHLFSIQLLWKPKILKNSFQSYANDFWHSAIEQIHGFALFLRCWWMKFKDIFAGWRQSMTSLIYKLCTYMHAFLARWTPALW